MSRNALNSVKLMRPKRNRFDLTHDVKMSMKMGLLYPTLVQECVPGDRFKLGCDSIVRFLPLVSPMLHRVDVYMHYFFVPYRLLWANWENYITQTLVGGVIPAHPNVQISNDAGHTLLCDYLGIPKPSTAGNAGTETLNAMPFAAYQLIWNEYYRDENLQNKHTYQLTDGYNGNSTSNPDLFALCPRCWEKDYFTASLPFTQKGNSVTVPGGAVTLDPTWKTAVSSNNPTFWLNNSGGIPSGSVTQAVSGLISVGASKAAYDPQGTLLSNNGTINDLRTAMRLQEFYERQARGGTRYVESILAHFGVRSSDARLNRPEYITGTKAPVIISEVLQTGPTSAGVTPQGNLAGHGISVQQGKYGGYFCEEHGLIMGIMSVMPKTAYMQGIPKVFTKTTDFTDYYWPEFANLGEQPVKNRELYAFQNAGSQSTAFGYTPRYAEYKFNFNRVAGDMRTTLNYWHMARQFSSAPALNATFVGADPTTRVFATTTGDTMVAQILHKISAIRPMPVYGTPTL